ncbi:MAG: FkbM family methyltransferase, partial [Rhodothermales bacterium]|nr:FkbM family methyltransferase [Rhodothermales bacterium]
DAVFEDYYRPGARAYLKLDVQGYERHVLDGAARALPQILGLQLEMSLVPLYDGETPFHEMLTVLDGLGFTLMSVEPVHADARTGQLLQVDGIFFRDGAAG